MKFKFNYAFKTEFNTSEVCKLESIVLLALLADGYQLTKYRNNYFILKYLDECVENAWYKIQSLENFVEI